MLWRMYESKRMNTVRLVCEAENVEEVGMILSNKEFIVCGVQTGTAHNVTQLPTTRKQARKLYKSGRSK